MMSSQKFDPPTEAQPKQSGPATVLRGFGFLGRAALIILLGLVPFLFGVVAQVISPRRIPPYVVGPLAAVLFFVLWRLTGWLQWRIGTGEPTWPSVVISLIMFVAFFSTGAAFVRELLPRRFPPASTLPTPQ